MNSDRPFQCIWKDLAPGGSQSSLSPGPVAPRSVVTGPLRASSSLQVHNTLYVENVGWIEIKPTLAALMAVEPKLREFADHLADIVPSESVARFYSLTAEHPRLYPGRGERLSPLVEWLPDELRGGNLAHAHATLRPPVAELFDGELARPYSDHVDCVLRLASERDFDEPLLLSEVAYGLLLRDGGLENLVWRRGRPEVSTDGAPPRPAQPPQDPPRIAHDPPGERADDRPRRPDR